MSELFENSRAPAAAGAFIGVLVGGVLAVAAMMAPSPDAGEASDATPINSAERETAAAVGATGAVQLSNAARATEMSARNEVSDGDDALEAAALASTSELDTPSLDGLAAPSLADVLIENVGSGVATDVAEDAVSLIVRPFGAPPRLKAAALGASAPSAPSIAPLDRRSEDALLQDATFENIAAPTLGDGAHEAPDQSPGEAPVDASDAAPVLDPPALDAPRSDGPVLDAQALVNADVATAAAPALHKTAHSAVQPLAVALSLDIAAEVRAQTVRLDRGETLVEALARAGVAAIDRNAAVVALGRRENLRRLRAGQTFALTTTEPNRTVFEEVSAHEAPPVRLLTLGYRPDEENQIEVRRVATDFEVDKSEIELTTVHKAVRGTIEGSLYRSAKREGLPDKAIIELANMFAYDVDFQRDIMGGDHFEAVVEMRYDDAGDFVSVGDIVFGRLKWRGASKDKGYYRFAASDGGRKADYFDAAGRSAKRLLMKTPIDGARLSSGFGARKHPILGYRKAHKGVDFAAPRGTPIYAAGDGVVERANRFGSFGNYIRIRHANGYKTAYAHLKGFKSGMRNGVRVEQGDVIGYVGTTGRSTGPHLHYEVHLNGKAVNPQRIKVATGRSLTGGALEKFKNARTKIDALRKKDVEAAPSLFAEDAASGEAL